MDSSIIMKISTLALLTSKSYFGVFSAVILSTLVLTACQQQPESEDTISAEAQNAVVATSTDNVKNTESNTQANVDTNIEAETADEVIDESAEQNTRLTRLQNSTGSDGLTPNAQTATPLLEHTIKSKQITDVSYRSTAGDALSVVFETSAAGTLDAIVTMPNKHKMTLSAPEGQGNNPTYRSADGSIQLVSHGGGSTIDLMQNGKLTSYKVVSAEAEVVTKPQP